MRTQWRLWLGFALFLSCVAVLAWLLLPPPASQVTMAAFVEIKEGMTLAEVEAVMGGQPGDYATGVVEVSISASSPVLRDWMSCEVVGTSLPGARCEQWYGDEGDVLVGFDEAGRVVWKGFVPKRRTRPWTPLERLHRLLERWGWK